MFTHPHGDHYGLYKKVPEDVPMYIGPMAKEILKVLVSRLDYISEEKGLPAVERTQTYQTEEQLGQKAEELFRQHKYNFVLVSSTNLDSIMEFFHHTPPGMHFVCDAYQAEIILTAMHGMERKGNYPQYQPSGGHSVIRVKGRSRWDHLRALGSSLKKPVIIAPVSDNKLNDDGFVMLVRKNTNPDRKSLFEEMRDEFYPAGGQIIYSMWDGYLKPEHADQALIDFIGGHPIEPLHTSGHAYVETIARLIETVQPKKIVPMHTEKADEFTSIPAFAPYRDRVQVLTDGMPLDLDKL